MKQYIIEAKFGHTLWIDPKGKVYDMNSRKEITHPKGHPYTHYDWVAANFTKYFGKTEPDNMGRVVYDAPHEKGWARVRNNPREIDVEVNLSKLTRSQKKTLQDIVDAGPEYGNKGINRPMYVDAWKKGKTSRSGDKAFKDYEEIRGFLGEVYADSGLGKWFGKGGKGGSSKGGWDRYNTKGEKVGKCGDSKPGEGTPKCLSKAKADKLRRQGGKKAIGNAAKRKKSQDSVRDKPGTGNKPVNVSNRIDKDTKKKGIQDSVMKSFKNYISEKNVPTDPAKWAASKAAAKSKFDVYPSAYANAWASKDYKKKGGGWKKATKESIELDEKMKYDPKAYYLLLKGKVYGPYRNSDKALSDSDGDGEIKLGKELTSKEKMKLESVEEGCGCDGTNEAKSAAWSRKEGQNSKGGLNAKGRKSYEKENPGSDLKAPVSAKQAAKSKGGKAAKRRKSFCARMGGMPGPMKDDKGKPTRKALALRKWDC